MNPTTQHDILTIGGGPAGAAAAALLAEQGHSVLVLEREKFPRYHVGESLIPFTFHPLERLGLIPAMRQSAFTRKYSVQFVSPSGKASEPFYFFNRYDRETVAQTWQVLRSEFDLLLLDNARAKGARVLEETTVTELLRDGDRVVGARARDRGGRVTDHLARITLDCTGKESFAAVRNGWRLKDPKLNKIAVWTYYVGAQREPGIDAGATTVAFVPERGWFWYIPQHRNTVSVGVVAEPKYLTRDGVKDPERIFQREIGQNAWIEQHLAAWPSDRPALRHQRILISIPNTAGPKASCSSATRSASSIRSSLPASCSPSKAVSSPPMPFMPASSPNDLRPERFQPYADTLRQGIENMRKLVYAFYDPGFSFRALTEKHPHLAGDVTDCLSGDVNKDFSQLWAAIREFAEIPDSLPYGQPLVTASQAAA
jgi:2-polyprenyl-6-methoxyphenol hydroxylase-like FAD-dependent oxidoreductase